jgi:hypothetical protein
MAVLPERETSTVAEWARALARFALVLFVTVSVGHRYGLVETFALFWVLGIVACLAILALCLAAGGFAMLWSRGDKAGRASLGAAVLAAAVLAPYAFGAFNVLRYPELTDISTDTVEPPQFRFAARLRTAAMNAIVPIGAEAAEAQVMAYPEVTGRRFDASMERVLAATVAVIEGRGWTPHAQTARETSTPELSLELFAPTLLLRYPVDAVIRLTDEGESTFVDMRMNSRYGRHDMGDGARRIASFMADLEAEFERQSLEIIDIPELPEDEDPVD